MRKINSISSIWGRDHKLEEKPFDTLKSKNVNSSSKYSSDRISIILKNLMLA